MCDCCDYIAANAGRASEEQLRAEYRRLWRRGIRKLIDEGKWLAIHVEEWPWPTYTIGLWSHGHPELCIFGLEARRALPMLNAVAAQVAAGLGINDGDELAYEDWPLIAFQLPNPEDVVPQANEFYRRKPQNSVPALQLVYPDAHGVWPWEPDCHLFPGQQPMPANTSRDLRTTCA
jgi:hypothetical protein